MFLACANTYVEHHRVFQACPPANVKPLGGGGSASCCIWKHISEEIVSVMRCVHGAVIAL